jgi:hypothetical protein
MHMTLDEFINRTPKKTPDSQPPPTSHNRSFTWYQVPLVAITRPTLESYKQILDDPKAAQTQTQVTRILLWIGAASIIFALGLILFVTIRLNMMEDAGSSAAVGVAITLYLLSPFSMVGVVMMIVVATGLMYAVARAIGGKGGLIQFAYLVIAYAAPLWILRLIAVGMQFLYSDIEPVAMCALPVVIWGLILYEFNSTLIALRTSLQLSAASALAATIVYAGITQGGVVLMLAVIATTL